MSSRVEAFREALKNDPRPISVDISCTVYNHGKYLRRALDGMLMQETDFPYRIIIHDDASTDNSAEIIREYQKRYPERIVAVIEEENLYQKGKSIYEKMFSYYTAKYIAVCEGDDYWLDAKKLQKQVDYLEANPDCASCYHNILPVNEEGEHDESLRHIYVLLPEGDYSEKEINQFSLKTQSASLVRRNINPFMTEKDKSVYCAVKCNGDEKVFVLWGAIGRVHYLSDVMAAHRRVLHGDSFTAKMAKMDELDNFLNAQKRFIGKCTLHQYFTGKNRYPYIVVLHNYLIFRLEHRGQLAKDDISKLKKSLVFPFYAYLGYVPYLAIGFFKTIIKRIQHKY